MNFVINVALMVVLFNVVLFAVMFIVAFRQGSCWAEDDQAAAIIREHACKIYYLFGHNTSTSFKFQAYQFPIHWLAPLAPQWGGEQTTLLARSHNSGKQSSHPLHLADYLAIHYPQYAVGLSAGVMGHQDECLVDLPVQLESRLYIMRILYPGFVSSSPMTWRVIGQRLATATSGSGRR